MPPKDDSNNGKDAEGGRSSGGEGRKTGGNIIDNSFVKGGSVVSVVDKSSGTGGGDGGQTRGNIIDTSLVKGGSFVNKSSSTGDGASSDGK
jgi:hypothetical protein